MVFWNANSDGNWTGHQDDDASWTVQLSKKEQKQERRAAEARNRILVEEIWWYDNGNNYGNYAGKGGGLGKGSPPGGGKSSGKGYAKGKGYGKVEGTKGKGKPRQGAVQGKGDGSFHNPWGAANADDWARYCGQSAGQSKGVGGPSYGRPNVTARAKPSKWDFETAKGVYILCPHGKCNGWCWYDLAGNSCGECGTPYNYKQFWEDQGGLPGSGSGAMVAAPCPAGTEHPGSTDALPLLDADMAIDVDQLGAGDPAPATDTKPSAADPANVAAAGDGKGKGQRLGKGQTAEQAKSPDGRRWNKARTPEEQAVVDTDWEVTKAWKAVNSASNRVAAEEKAMAKMGTELEGYMQTLKLHADAMQERRSKLHELREENAAAYKLHGERLAARETAYAADNAAQGSRLASSVALLVSTTGLQGHLGSLVSQQGSAGSGTPAPGSIAAATPLVAVKAEVSAAPTSTLPENGVQTVHLFSDSDGRMDAPNYYDGGESDSDDDTTAGTEINGLELDEWKEHMAAWVFQATPGEAAPAQLVRVFCGDGEGKAETAAALGLVVDQIRDALWTERQGEAEDVAKIQAFEAAGDLLTAYNMRYAQGLYAQDKYKQMRAHLFTKLDFGLNDLKALRQAKVEDGSFVAAKEVGSYKLKKRAGLAAVGKGAPKKGTKGSGAGKGGAGKAAVQEIRKPQSKEAAKEANAAVAATKAKLLESAKDIKTVSGESASDAVAESSQTAAAN